MRIVFMGTGHIAVPTFRALIAGKSNIAGLVTQPDRPVGRHQLLTAPPLKPIAQTAGIPVLQPESLRDPNALEELRSLQPDLIIVMAYGQILPQEIIDLPQKGCVNLHASLLPRHRGAACIQSALAAGDEEIGVTLMHVVKKLDSGDIIAQEKRLRKEDETGGDAHDDLAEMAAKLTLRMLSELENGTAPRCPQEENLVTYAPKLLREDGRIDWSEDALSLARKIRAYSPWPGTFTTYTDNKGKVKKLKIHPPVEMENLSGKQGSIIKAEGDNLIIACGKQALKLKQIQPEGSKPMDARSFISGNRQIGDTFLGMPE